MNSTEITLVTYDDATDVEGKGVLGDHARELVEQTVVFLMLPLNILGVITNLINIRVFVEQGVRNDVTNIGFVSLSLFDLLSCATLIPYSLCYVVKYTDGLSQHVNCIGYATLLTFGHILIQYCSAWTTVYMSVVRSLCVVLPLKVKLLFTPTISIAVIVFIFVFFFVTSMLYFAFIEITQTFSPMFNTTIVTIVDKPFSREYLYINNVMNNHVLSVVAIIIVFITSGLLVHKLFQVKKWRQKNASKSGNKSKENNASDKKLLGSKDVELVKSVTIVTCIFAVCGLMGYLPATAVVILPGVNFTGVNRNLFYTIYIVRFLFDAVNSSINFFFYIRISTRYKAAFASSFPLLCSTQDGE